MEPDLDEPRERLDLERLPDPDRDALERLEDEPELALVDRLDEPERDPPEPDLARLDADLDRELLAREPELRDPLDERLEPFEELRELLDDERRELDREAPACHSATGISSLATVFASWAICFSRNFAMRSSSRRIPRASLTVSLSFTVSASASMPV